MTPQGTPLRVGAYYLPRGGQAACVADSKCYGPLYYDPKRNRVHTFSSHKQVPTWTADGIYNRGIINDTDLVLECTADGVPLIGTETPAAYEGECSWLKTVAKPKPAPFAFAAGQFYGLANGGVTGPMMRSADDTYWCDPEHKNAHGAPWEYRDDGTTEPAEFNIVGLADDGVKTAKPSAKPGTELEIRGAWIPKGDALTVASLIGACEHMLYKRQALQDEGRPAYADSGSATATAVLDPVIEDPLTCELRVGDIIAYKKPYPSACRGHTGEYPVVRLGGIGNNAIWFDPKPHGKGVQWSERDFFTLIRRAEIADAMTCELRVGDIVEYLGDASPHSGKHNPITRIDKLGGLDGDLYFCHFSECGDYRESWKLVRRAKP